MNPLLKIESLCKDFNIGWAGSNRIRVLHDINLNVRSGETFGIIGESGCGKTTLARCATLLLYPTSGAIEFDGESLLDLGRDELRKRRLKLQMVFQNAFASLDPRLSVRKILAQPFQAHGIEASKEWMEEVLGLMSLDAGLLDRRPASLSGGEQQRVAIARALALKPRLLIADEPVSALDSSVQAQVLNALADLQVRLNLTIVLISHSLPVIYYLAARVAVMYLGRIVEQSSAQHFFNGPKHPYSRLLMDCAPGCGWKPTTVLPEQMPLRSPGGCSFHPRCPHAFDRCRAEQPSLLSCDASTEVACFLYA